MASAGKTVLELPPVRGNPRNSEGAFIRLSDGRILFVYSKFVGDTAQDHAPSCIAARVSSDNGDTFTGEDRIIFRQEDYAAQNVMSVSLLPMLDGAIGLFFGVRYGFHNTGPYLSRSYDDGETWTAGQRVIPAFGYYVVNNDRIIRLKSGRILVPANLHRTRNYGEDIEDYSGFDGRGTGYFFYSDDDGKTFREARTCCNNPNPLSASGLQETGVMELQSGAVWAYYRTDLGCHYQSWSHDEGDTWSPPTASAFTGPCSPLCMKRLSDGRIIAVWNPIPLYQTREETRFSWGRTPLVAAISGDDGRTFGRPVTVEDGGDKGGYAYTAIFQAEDSVLLAYTAGRPDDPNMLARLRMKKVPLSVFD